MAAFPHSHRPTAAFKLAKRTIFDVWCSDPDCVGAVATDALGMVGRGEELIELPVKRLAPAEQVDQPLHVLRHEAKVSTNPTLPSS